MGSAEGATKTAARRVGVSVDEYRRRVENGQKWCSGCRQWRSREDFAVDRSRGDGLVARCYSCRRVANPRQRVDGPPSVTAENAATNAVRTAIRRGNLPPATACSCEDCGEPAEQYHHDKGYEPEHRLDVVPLCRSCHVRRHWETP